MFNFSKIKKILFLFIFLILVAGCSDSNDILIPDTDNNNKLSKTYQELTAKKIELLAEGLVMILKNENARRILYEEISNSTKTEKIVEASDFLKKTRKNLKLKNKKDYTNFFQGMSDLFDKDTKKLYNELLKDLKFGEIDIYFPVKEHLKNWNASENILIAGITSTNEEYLNNFSAFDLDGNEVQLTSAEIPETPVLVIYPSEKGGNYNPNFNANNSDKISLSPTLPADPPPGNPTYTYSVSVKGVLIAQHYDSWPFGELEVYLKIKTKLDGGVWSAWKDIPEGASTEFPGVYWIDADPGHWKYGTRELFRETKNFSIMVEIWEQDSFTDPDDFVADQYYSFIKECGDTGILYPYNDVIRCDFDPCTDFFLQDGVYPGSDYDMLKLRFYRWQ